MFPVCVLETETVAEVSGPEGSGCDGSMMGVGAPDDEPELEQP